MPDNTNLEDVQTESMQEATASGKSTMTPEAALALFAMVNSVPQQTRDTLLTLMLEILAAQENAFKAWHDSQTAELRADKERLDKWLTKQVHRGEGVVTLGLTEDGIVGVWLPQSYQPDAKCDGAADSALAAIDSARNQDSTNQRGE